MSKKQTSNHYVLTANDLATGDVVFWSKTQTWSAGIANAAVETGPSGLETLKALGTKGETANDVVGAYPLAVSVCTSAPGAGPDRLHPVGLREQKRLAGPSIAFGPGAQAANAHRCPIAA